MRVGVTGVAGYVGSVLAGELLSAGYAVVGLDALMHGGESLLGLYGHPRFHFIRGDLRDARKVAEFASASDAVVHLAAIVGEPACNRDPDLTRAVNLEASLQLIDAARDAGIRRFVFASTCSNYGRSGSPIDYLDEQSPLQPLSVYAETKVAVERHLLDGAWPKEFAPTVLRLATVFGLSARPRFDLTVNEFTAELLLNGELAVFGEQFWRPYVHVRDVARAIRMVLEAPRERVDREVYNVGSRDQNYRKQQLVDMISARVRNVSIKYVERASDPRDYRVDFTKIERTLGFRPVHTVESGIEEIIGALQSGIVRDFRQPRYRN